MKQLIKKILGMQEGNISESAKSILNDRNFSVFDVGAAVGLLPHWQCLNNWADIYAVEPGDDAAAVIEKTGIYKNVVRKGLSMGGGQQKLYLTNVPTGSSLLKYKEPFSPYVDESYFSPHKLIDIDTISFSDLLKELNVNFPDMIKLDTQGTELSILMGLPDDVIKKTSLIELEVGMPGFYEGQCTFNEVFEFMNTNGFELFDIRVARGHLNREGGSYQEKVFGVYNNSPSIAAHIHEMDVIFFRKPSPELSDEEKRRLIISLCVYNFYCEAYSLAGTLSENSEEVQKSVKEWHDIRCCHFTYRDNGFYQFLRKIQYKFSHKSAPRWCQHMYQEYPHS